MPKRPTVNVDYQNKLRHRERMIDAQKKRDLFEIMQTPNGRRFIYALIFDRLGFTSVYPGSDAGIHRQEGKRQVAFDLTDEIQSNYPDLWILMVQEQLAMINNDAILRKAAEAAVPEEDEDGRASSSQ